MNIDIKPVFYIVGIFLCILAASMAIPIMCDLYNGNPDWKAFAVSLGITGFTGILLMLANKEKDFTISGRQAFILTAVSWSALSFFAAIPFILTFPSISITDAVFEAVSGLTTTGSTVLTGLDGMPYGILLWRALLHWLGGIGIIVMAISILPYLKVGGMQLFRLESSEREKALPKVTDMTKGITIAYVILSIACYIAYYYSGMTIFDAATHAMATMSTGGFSTHDTSFAGFSNMAKIFSMFFMLIACFPFIIFVKAYASSIREIFTDTQIHAFLKINAACLVIMLTYFILTAPVVNTDTLIDVAFNTVSVSTGTGYASTDYNGWGSFAIGFFLFISCIGGCAGSASCGIKIFRLQILYSVMINQLRQLIYPNAIFTVQYRNEPLSVSIAAAVMGFFFIYILSLVIFTLLLLATNLDFITALSGAVTSLSNVGPGLGEIIGPVGNFQPLPDTSKWIMIVAMMLGRLEFFTLLVFFSPRFWKG